MDQMCYCTLSYVVNAVTAFSCNSMHLYTFATIVLQYYFHYLFNQSFWSYSRLHQWITIREVDRQSTFSIQVV